MRCKLQDLIQCTNDTDDSLEEDIDLNLLDYVSSVCDVYM